MPHDSWKQLPWRRRAASLAAGLLAALVPALAVGTPPVERAELATHDLRFQARGRRSTGARVVLVLIQDSTLAAWPEPLVFWGEHFAAALRRARAAGAGWIGLDFVPTVIARWEPEFGRALAEGRVVLSYTGRQLPSPTLLYSSAEQPGNLGYTDLPGQPDTVVRRLSLYQQGPDGAAPSFAALLARRIRPDSPVPAAGSGMWINYVGPPGSFSTLPLEKLAGGNLSPLEREQLRGATVLIGASYTGANDLHRGPQGEYLGTEVLAHAVATLVDRRPLRRAAPVTEGLITGGIGLSCAALLLFLSLGWGTGLALLFSAAWSGLCLRAFAGDALWPLFTPLLSVWLGWAGHYAVRSVEEARQRRVVQELFGQHVSRSVVERMLRNPELARLGGERRELTILFSDIRGFTSLSERTAPDEVMARLNDYLPAMEACVFRLGGTLDKYIGDAVMAFWNAPEAQPDHAARAVLAAWMMVRELEAVNARWEAEGKSPFQIGIGVNTGEVVVGHVGSERFKSYTVIGSAVNQAARLESATKDVPAQVLLGEATYRQVQGCVTAREHMVTVKGVDHPLRVYELLDVETEALASIKVNDCRPAGAPR